MNLSNAWAVARRELRSFFDHPTAYILLVVFYAVNFFFFFRTVFVSGEASLRQMFAVLPWLLLFFVPAVAMRSLAEERQAGTVEVVLSQPIREIEFLLGKYVGVLSFLLIALLGTLGVPFGLSFGGDLQGGVIATQYVGTALLMAGLVAVAVWASSMTRNQITAFILAIAVTFVLYSLSLDVVLLSVPQFMAAAAVRLGVISHFESIQRGVIDLRDVVYFVTLSATFLSLAYWAVLRHQLYRHGSRYRALRIGVVGIVGICLLVNLVGRHIRGRLDLTPGKVYTLSPETREVLRNLPDIVTVKFFASRELPPQADLVKRDVEDMLADYSAAGAPNLVVQRLTPEADNADREEAMALGIPGIRFNVLGQEEFQIKQGYLGIALQYADRTELIPVIQRTDDLEYRLTSSIRNVTSEGRTTIAFLTGHGEPEPRQVLNTVGGRLLESYRLTQVDLSPDTASMPDSVDIVIAVGPRFPLQQREGDELRRFLEEGGRIMLLLDGANVNQEILLARPRELPVLDSLLSLYNLSIGRALVFDLQSNAPVQSQSPTGLPLMVSYPLWPATLPASSHVMVANVGSVITPWASPIEFSPADTVNLIPLLGTTEFGGRANGEVIISPDRDWTPFQDSIAPQLVAVAHTGSAVGLGRLVLVGNSGFAGDGFAGQNPGNLSFFLNAVDWLAQDEALLAIRIKNRSPGVLLFKSAGVRDTVKYANLIGVPLLFVLYGAVRLFRRRRLQQRAYEPA
jgi:ABC-2 type transport system permease protein